MKAVMWTDLFQCLMMFVGLITVIINGIRIADGGFMGIWRSNEEGERIEFDK